VRPSKQLLRSFFTTRGYFFVPVTDAEERPKVASWSRHRYNANSRTRSIPILAYLEVLPLASVFLLFFVVPIALVVVVSFFGYETYRILIPTFTLDNFRDVFSESVTYRTYLTTVKFCAIVWAITAVLGFLIAYFLVFQVRSRVSQTVLLLVCSIPFWTSIVIRMIAWIPLLGRNGLVNRVLVAAGITNGPLEWLLYSEFAVIIGYVHLYTLMMIVPVFNSMMRIDRALVEAATDAGASTLQVLWTLILPLSKPGIAIGSIFVIAMVMGDFVTVDVLGGGQVASVGKQIATQLSYLQFPPAAANALVLLVAVIAMIAFLVKVVDIRKEL
jgi:putative spermidine/putrescine transport system permease protein